ncbi:putative phosphomannomutase-like protein [Trypanosoma cruzi]|nr:putative phosphomannomutase-like protein [Trypanosoma cruzi]
MRKEINIRSFGAWVVLLICGVASVTAEDVAESGRSLLPALYDAERVHALTCCELVERHWPLLRSWDRCCASSVDATGDNKVHASFEELLHHFWDAPLPGCNSGGITSCNRKEHSLSDEFLTVFLKERLCADLPATHTELARSVYSVFVVEDPLHEDDLITIMEEACKSVQHKGIILWRRSLRARNVYEAQEAVCQRHCSAKRSFFDGDFYDL